MGKKTGLKNDFCQACNDGFGCEFLERGSASWCLECLLGHLKDVVDDIVALKKEAFIDEI